MRYKDRRMQTIDEMLYGTKSIKYNQLENFFFNKIRVRRSEELSQFKKQRIL